MRYKIHKELDDGEGGGEVTYKCIIRYTPDGQEIWMEIRRPVTGDEVNRSSVYERMWMYNRYSERQTKPWIQEIAATEIACLIADTNIGVKDQSRPNFEEGVSFEEVLEFIHSLPWSTVERVWREVPYVGWGLGGYLGLSKRDHDEMMMYSPSIIPVDLDPTNDISHDYEEDDWNCDGPPY